MRSIAFRFAESAIASFIRRAHDKFLRTDLFKFVDEHIAHGRGGMAA